MERRAAELLLAAGALAAFAWGWSSAGAAEVRRCGVAAAADTVELVVPAATPPSQPIAYAADLAQGDRLLIDVEGEVAVARDDDSRGPVTSGRIPTGALVGTFGGGPPFLIGRGRLLWTAPAAGRLGFAVEGGGSGEPTGSYRVRLTPLGPRGDPRQRRFAPPHARFLPGRADGPLLELSLVDRSGLGLDRKTLRVFLDTRDGGRVVLTPWFEIDSRRAASAVAPPGDPAPADSFGARLPALPTGAGVPPGVHRVIATVADALGNESPPATVYFDNP